MDAPRGETPIGSSEPQATSLMDRCKILSLRLTGHRRGRNSFGPGPAETAHTRVLQLQQRGILGQSQTEHLLRVVSTLEPRGDILGGSEDEQLAKDVYASRTALFASDEVDRLLLQTEGLWDEWAV